MGVKMYINDITQFKIMSFKEFLKEVNYGSMTSDERINDITNQIYDDMISNVTDYKLFGSINVAVSTKGKNPTMKFFLLEWQFKVFKTDNPKQFSSGAWIEKKSMNEVEIGVNILFDKQLSNEQFRDKLLDHIQKQKLNECIKHEVKHFVDFVDGKFINDKTYTTTPDSSDESKTKYVSQNKEIEAWLISVLSDLERIRQEKSTSFRSISLQDALLQSQVYNRFMKYLTPSKRSKYKTKIVHFWYEKFEKGKLVV